MSTIEATVGRAIKEILTEQVIISANGGWVKHYSLRAEIHARTGLYMDASRLHQGARWLRDRGYPLVATRGNTGWWKLAGVTAQDLEAWDIAALRNHYEELVRHARAAYRANLPHQRQRTIGRAIAAGSALGIAAVDVRAECEPVLNGTP